MWEIWALIGQAPIQHILEDKEQNDKQMDWFGLV